MRIAGLTFITPVLLLAATSLANAPTTRPTTHTLSPQGIRYDVPASLHVTFTEADEVPYLSDDDVSCMIIKVLPRGTQADSRAAEGKVSSLLEQHKKNDDVVIESPLIEIDPPFSVRIHERYALKMAGSWIRYICIVRCPVFCFGWR